MSNKIKLQYEINLWVVGKSGNIMRFNAPGLSPAGALFTISKVTLKVGVTKKNEFTLGQDGRLNISLSGFQHYNTKMDFLNGLFERKLNFFDFKNTYEWQRIVKIKDNCKFTDALINNIFRKTESIELWINRDLELLRLPGSGVLLPKK